MARASIRAMHQALWAREQLHAAHDPLAEVRYWRARVRAACAQVGDLAAQLGFSDAQLRRLAGSVDRAHVPDDAQAVAAYWERCALRLARWAQTQHGGTRR